MRKLEKEIFGTDSSLRSVQKDGFPRNGRRRMEKDGGRRDLLRSIAGSSAQGNFCLSSKLWLLRSKCKLQKGPFFQK